MADQPAPPAPESLSIADRVAAQFGLTDTDEAPEPTPEAPNPEDLEAAPEEEGVPNGEEFAEVELNGERFKVPKALEPALLQHKDYTQKTQAVADQRRQFEVLQEQGKIIGLQKQFESEAETEIAQLKAYDAVLTQKVEWEKLSNEDAFRTQLQRNTWKEERDVIARALQQKFAAFNEKRESAMQELKGKALEVVSKRIPNFNDATLKEIREHAKGDGYTEVELAAIDADPRHIVTLNKAMQYDKLMASKAKAVQTANKAPPMVKPGTTRPMPQNVKNDFALAKAQKSATNSADKAKIIQKRLESMF
jgi:hypothetical protein